MPPLSRQASGSLVKTTGSSSTLWSDQAFPTGVTNELSGGMDVELAHRACPMGLDGLDTNAEQDRSILVAVAFGDELNHLALALRQRGRAAAGSGFLNDFEECR